MLPKSNVQSYRIFLRRWGPALAMMAIIFLFSSLPSNNIPSFGKYELSVKKGGHALGYLLLGRAYLYGIGKRKIGPWLAWGCAILYACSDEFHQSFVPGRTPSPIDVAIDSLGAFIGLVPAWLQSWRGR